MLAGRDGAGHPGDLVGGADAPQHPDGEAEVLREDGQRQVLAGDPLAAGFPERLVVGLGQLERSLDRRDLLEETGYDFGDFSEETKPQGSLLLSNTWDTDHGKFGVLVDVAYSELATRTDSIQFGVVEELVERAKKVAQQGRRVQKGADNMLVICSHGRWMATDPKLVGIDDPEESKLDAVADEMMKVWRTYPDELQIGFSDVGTPNDEEQATYGRLKEKLVERGMPAARIRFIHEAKNGNDKAALFAECRRDGGTLVILGSTDKLGTGTNIQHRCIAIHDIDAPYRPSDLEQRLGRVDDRGARDLCPMQTGQQTATPTVPRRSPGARNG